MSDKTITVFTATYNRKDKLRRAFRSLLNQTSKDFIWLIIDDGSIDGTSEMVKSLIDEADFQIEYYWKENGGRHTAVNYSHEHIRTPYVVTLDSDDELTPQAIELMIKRWNEIPKSEYNRFWCVSGRDADATTGIMVGAPYPENINQLRGRKQRKVLYKISGEKHCCRKSEIYKQYKFTEYEDTKFVLESTVWEKINHQYDQYCVNDIFGLYYTDSEDSLGKGTTHKSTRHKTFYYASLFYVNELFGDFFINPRVPKYTVNLSRCAMLCNVPFSTVMKSINAWYKRITVAMGYPISYLWILLHK